MATKARKKEALQALECLGPKVTLQARVKVGRKWLRFNAAYDERGHVLTNVVVMHGEQVEFPICHYELRYTDADGEHRPPVGDDAATAEEERKIVAAQLAVKKAAEQVGPTTTKQIESAKPQAESPDRTQLVTPPPWRLGPLSV